MRLGAAQRVVLRMGAGFILLAGLVATGFAVLVPSGGASGLVVSDGTSVDLPSPGLFGGASTVYGVTKQAGSSPTDLGCTLLTGGGGEQSVARMSSLAVVGADPLLKDGQRFIPLFEVRSYPSGSSVTCTDADRVAPLAVSTTSTFGGLGSTVRLFAATVAVACFLVAGVALVVLRTREPRVTR